MENYRPIQLNRRPVVHQETAGKCVSCGARAPTKRVEFYRILGAIIVYQLKSEGGQWCKSCVHRHFWEYTLFTLCFGWWGIISFFLTPFILSHNVIRYVGCLRMPAVPPSQPKAPAPAPPSEWPNAQNPAAKKMEVIWDLQALAEEKRQPSKPVPESHAEGGNATM